MSRSLKGGIAAQILLSYSSHIYYSMYLIQGSLLLFGYNKGSLIYEHVDLDGMQTLPYQLRMVCP